MSNSNLKHKSFHSGRYLVGLLGLLFSLNLAAFLIYRETAARESLLSYIWYYLDSGPFNIISASLILPIVLFLLESKFKIAETALKNLDDRRVMEEQAHKKRIEIERQDRKTRDLEAISQTIKWWNDIYGLAAEIRYFTKPKGDEPTIEDSLKGLIRTTCAGDDVLNRLVFTFRNLTISDISIFRKFFSMLLLSSDTVARCVWRNKMTSQEIEELQDCLEVILEGVGNIAYHRIIGILKLSSDFHEAEEDKAEAKEKSLASDIERLLDVLRKKHEDVLKYEETHNTLLCVIKGDKGESLRMKAKSLKALMEEKRKPDWYKSTEFNEMKEAFHNIPAADRFMALNMAYSPEYIKDLADFMDFETLQVRAQLY